MIKVLHTTLEVVVALVLINGIMPFYDMENLLIIVLRPMIYFTMEIYAWTR